MTPLAFWVLDAGMAGAGATIVLIFGRAIGRRLTAGPEEGADSPFVMPDLFRGPRGS